MPGHKPMKDRLTLLLCANASGDLKVKPLLVYHSENPRAFKKHKVQKSQLNVLWKSNTKAWVTRLLFVEWMNEAFGPAVKKYLSEKKLPLRALLVMDNVPAHPPSLKDHLLDEFKFIEVRFFPPNTTPLLQPMDQQVISNFKKIYIKELFQRCFELTEETNLTLREFWQNHFNIVHCLKIIDKAWNGVSQRTLVSAWTKLRPHIVHAYDFKGLSGEQEPPIIDVIVSLGKTLGLEVNEPIIQELVEEEDQELTTNELIDLHREQHQEVKEVISSGEEEDENSLGSLPSDQIREICKIWETVQLFVAKHHPNKPAALRATDQFNDNAMSHFHEILKKRQKQQSLDHAWTSKNVREWCREFNEGRINVHDEQRSARPSLPESTVARIDEMVLANRRITLEEIEDDLNEDCSHFSVHKIVSETLGYRKVSARWVGKWLKEAANGKENGTEENNFSGDSLTSVRRMTPSQHLLRLLRRHLSRQASSASATCWIVPPVHGTLAYYLTTLRLDGKPYLQVRQILDLFPATNIGSYDRITLTEYYRDKLAMGLQLPQVTDGLSTTKQRMVRIVPSKAPNKIVFRIGGNNPSAKLTEDLFHNGRCRRPQHSRLKLRCPTTAVNSPELQPRCRLKPLLPQLQIQQTTRRKRYTIFGKLRRAYLETLVPDYGGKQLVHPLSAVAAGDVLGRYVNVPQFRLDV
ncbi:hypothetical protein LAZ67_2006082 [Cordylochernes scorpioides]|uniref:DDE-1 domain-containing protein n=1 Tax=Cordylochernes scorpioides TaxID=51811 RepID=A0ABY6K6K0_9ARAC|nr:hypothetical protein LAZ67_2006082 [Cordylochernes scorpioides]